MTRSTGGRLLVGGIATLVAAGALLAATGVGMAANTRQVYFGAPEDVCPASVTDDTSTYPNGCGGGIGGTGTPTDGVIVLSPTAVSTTNDNTKLVGYRLKVQNTSGQTLTKVTVLGGALAGLTANPNYPPPSPPSPPNRALPGTLGSLPPGFSYAGVYPVSGPAPQCQISMTTAAADSLRCRYGNLAAGSTASVITIVLQAPADVADATCPTDAIPTNVCRVWNELQLNEGSSSSGSNVDSFFAISQLGGLVVSDSTDVYAESFIAPSGTALAGGGTGSSQPITTTPSFTTSETNPLVTRVVVPKKPDGSDARILETGAATDIEPGCALLLGKEVTCFGQVANVAVLTPINITVTGTQAPELFGDCPPGEITLCTTSSTIAPLRIDLAWDGSQLPGRVSARNLQVVHIDDNGQLLVVTNVCASGPTPGSPLPCRTAATKYGKKGLQVTVYTASNGGWKPGY